ncbi:hypothetical protein [Alloalcanivorax gelatiniphagus]|uniref:DUF4175 domain-containing protein n=1 Tax=Alloalcanivorax gelatiniphagus TaxID=1194167 RepID=A0ABY2XJV7_9GAMM|nr:hypothetical protein [Alloalcanivorax gelatiniphagus]TMW12230.1 hypothetical protein FGS76_12135 [Alloalcanivorax gelatiniphagus]|tara:strand:- start:10257 stop:10448 length:192 start_codon:yes stop_codon:yes gene_type:complete
MNSAPRPARRLRHIFAVPLLIALASLIGLMAALLGDGPMDWLSWLGLGLPVAAVAWAMGTRRR